jgi:hypothetical protein
MTPEQIMCWVGLAFIAVIYVVGLLAGSYK